MRVSETDRGLLFILTNKDLKAIKRSHNGIGFNAAKENIKTHYSFMSEDHFEKQYQKQLEEQQKLVNKLKEKKDGTDGITEQTERVHTKS